MLSYSPFLYSKVKAFCQKFGPGIVNSIRGTNLFFSAVAAQSMFESGYGERIPEGSNNFGGIKYNASMPGVVGYVWGDTTEYTPAGKMYKTRAKFAKFADVESGFKAHIQVLLADRYANARNLAKNPDEQILMIVKAGYSTTPPATYLKSMKGIIDATTDFSKIGRVK